MSSEDYEVPWLATFFHSFPHIDLSFKQRNATFDPTGSVLENKYHEALLFWAALPVLWLLVTLLIFLMYFCYRCCQRDQSKKQHGTCLPWAMAILALLAGGAVGVGFYGNEEAHKGVSQFAQTGSDAGSTIKNMHAQVAVLKDNVVETVQLLNNLNSLIERRKFNDSFDAELKGHVSESVRQMEKIDSSVQGIDTKSQKVHFQDNVHLVYEYGIYRWLATVGLLCWMVLLLLLLLFGIGKSSKCTLLMFCAFGIFTLVLCWVSAGVHLAASVFLGDFCVAPDVYLQKMGVETMDPDIVRYYIKCNHEVTNPFSKPLKDALDSVTAANTSRHQVKVKAGNAFNRLSDPDDRRFALKENVQYNYGNMSIALDRVVRDIQMLTALVECANIHKDYSDAIEGACYLALPGVVFLMLSGAGTGLLITILVLLASCAWRHFSPRKYSERKDSTEMKGYREVDEDEQFLPHADNASPTYYRYGGGGDSISSRPNSTNDDSAAFPRGRNSNPREHVPMHRRSSPPPAYSTNEFYRQYNDMSGSLGDSTPPPRGESLA